MSATRRGPWSASELVELKAMIDAGKTIPDIARVIDRTQEATRSKATQHGWYAYPSRLFKRPPLLDLP